MSGTREIAGDPLAAGGEGQGACARLWTRRGLLGAGALAVLGWWAGGPGGTTGGSSAGPRIRLVALRRASLYAAHDRAG